MKIIYTVTLVLLVFALIKANKWTKSSSRSIVATVHPLMYSVVVVVFSSMIATMVADETAAMTAQGIHNASSDFMLFFLFRFVRQYTLFENPTLRYEKKRKVLFKWIDGVIIAVSLLDFVSLMVNVYYRHIFTCESVIMPGGDRLMSFVPTGMAFYGRLAYVYILLMLSVILLIAKIYNTPGFYRNQYILTLVVIALAVIVDVINTVVGVALDFSLYAYVLLGIFFCVYPIIYIPRYLTNRVVKQATEVMSGGVVCFDEHQECVYANEHVLKLFPLSRNLHELSREFRDWIECENVKDFPSNIMQKTIGEGKSIEYYDIECSRLVDSNHDYLGSFFLLSNRTEDVNRLERERYLATHDTMTNIYNRDRFYRETEKLIKANPDTVYYMVCSNVKDFKLVNELFGIGKGNELLIAFANTLREYVKPGAVYGRLESDHFALCIPKARFNENEFIERIRKIGETIDCDAYHTHIYLGIYEVKDITMPAASMCDHAKMAIDTVKGNYQYCAVYYTDDMMSGALYEKNLVSEFDSALEKKQFKMFLQPQTDADGNMLGAEALVRWQHPERGMVPPGSFISVFEKTGLIYKLDQYIWRCACEKLKDWKDRGLLQYYISVNISPKDFYYLDIYSTFVDLVNEYHILPANLKLEITETAIMSDFNKQFILLKRLREYGFQIEIDDFGSGYSSLNMLKDMPVDVLKIDMGFLRQTEHIKRSRIILEAIVSLSKRLEMPVVVEGVETKEQLSFLKELECEAYQGYYFSKPIPVEEFENKYM
jgi:diguanylate cyclase (GGDEF)-like protein